MVGKWHRALVTGASSGIGEAIAHHLAAQGVSVVAVGRDCERTAAVAGALIGDGHEAIVADLSQPVQVQRIADRLASEPAIDLLVNCAGYASSGPLESHSAADELDLVAVSVLALVSLTHAAVSAMIPAGRGAILNISSVAGMRPVPNNASYAASKAFVISFSQAIADEVGEAGITVTCVCPGFTRSRFLTRAGYDASAVAEHLFQEPAEVARIALTALADGDRLVLTNPADHQRLAALVVTAPPPVKVV